MGSRTDSRQIRESSREFATESTREFARVRESSREFASEFAIEFAKPKDARGRIQHSDSQRIHIRRVRGLTQIRERIHSGITRVLTQCSQFTAVNPSMAFDKSALYSMQ